MSTTNRQKVAKGEMVEKELDAMIERWSRQGEADRDEQEELWKASVRAHNARRREENRAAWAVFHEGQANRLRGILEGLIAHHTERAEKYREAKPGEAA